MNQMNQIVIEGNVVRDSLVKQTPRGTRVCVMPIATNHHYKDSKGETQTDVTFLDIQAWGENFSSQIARMAKKGRGVRVVGRLKQDRWKSNDGKSASKIYVIAEHIDFNYMKNNSSSDSEDEKMAESAAEGIKAESEYLEESASETEETVF